MGAVEGIGCQSFHQKTSTDWLDNRGLPERSCKVCTKPEMLFAGVAHLSMEALRVDRTTLKRSLPLREYGTGYAT